MITIRSRWAAALVLGPAFFIICSAAALAAPATEEEAAPEEAAAPAVEESPHAAPASKPEPATEPPPVAASPVEPPQPPPPNVPPIPATGMPYIQHLGPESFPGRLRGLYGGSLWQEPSFNGLQWPYMAHTGIGVSGNVWMDSGRELINRDNSQIPNSALWYQQGRGVLRLTPTYAADNFFVQGQIELVGNMCQSANKSITTPNTVCQAAGTFSTDDLWIRVGQWNRWDLKVGRFEGWEVYHLGLGMEQYTFERQGARNFGLQVTNPPFDAPVFYGATFMHDRPTDGLAAGYAALHLYPSDWLRFEVLGKLGVDNNINDNSTGDTPMTSFGGRPTAILDLGWLKVKVGGEYQKAVPITQTIQPGMPGMKVEAAAKLVQKGFGGSIQVIASPFLEFGVSAGAGDQHSENGFAQVIQPNTFSVKSVGGFATLKVCDVCLLGLGLHYTAQTDSVVVNTSSPANDFSNQLQGFASFQYLVGGQLFIKPDFALARALLQPSDPSLASWYNTMYNLRVRLMYLF